MTVLLYANPALPGNCALTWLSGSEHCSVGLEHCIVDEFLVLGEGAIGREGAGDVRGIAVVLSTHVKQTAMEFGSNHIHTSSLNDKLQCPADTPQISILNGSIKQCSFEAIRQNGRVGTTIQWGREQ